MLVYLLIYLLGSITVLSIAAVLNHFDVFNDDPIELTDALCASFVSWFTILGIIVIFGYYYLIKFVTSINTTKFGIWFSSSKKSKQCLQKNS